MKRALRTLKSLAAAAALAMAGTGQTTVLDVDPHHAATLGRPRCRSRRRLRHRPWRAAEHRARLRAAQRHCLHGLRFLQRHAGPCPGALRLRPTRLHAPAGGPAHRLICLSTETQTQPA